MKGAETAMGESWAVVGHVAVSRGAFGEIGLSPDGRRPVASNYGDGSVSAVDTGHAALAVTIGGIREALPVAPGPDGATGDVASFAVGGSHFQLVSAPTTKSPWYRSAAARCSAP
jgi:hypothetical protein